MFHDLQLPDECLELWGKCHALVADLIENCPVKTTDLLVTLSTPITTDAQALYYVKNGMISERNNGQLIVNYEEGDLIGADWLFSEKQSLFENDFAVTVDEYDADMFLEHISSNKELVKKWAQYVSYLNESFQIAMCHFSKQETSFKPSLRSYDEGQIIIEENTDGDDVFTLLTGCANVYVDGNKVGEIVTDEIFGAIAALTGTKRNATIIAASDCEALVVEKDRFKGLLASCPETVHKLITDMAKSIVAANEKIIKLSSK